MTWEFQSDKKKRIWCFGIIGDPKGFGICFGYRAIVFNYGKKKNAN